MRFPEPPLVEPKVMLYQLEKLSQQWEGTVPYMYAYYVASGAPLSGFSAWLTTFRGDARPQDDISGYLHDFLNVNTASFNPGNHEIESDIRPLVKEIWIQIHEERRN